VLRLAALVSFLAIAAAASAATVAPLPPSVREELQPDFWHKGCPVALSQLRVLTVRHWGFDGRAHTGQLIVNADVAAPLTRVFHKLYELRFPIRHMLLDDYYGAKAQRPTDTDVSASFECRQASASPCGGLGNRTTGHWSQHAYGHAVDLNPVENPYVGCGQSRDPRTRPYRDRSRHRKGMVTPAVVAAFRSIGWGWGGSWTGDTKDYMHFSKSGH
jgi:D-alanyl-D-alanine carboxypeptidase